MEIVTKKCFIERSVQFEEDQVHDPQPTEEEEGIITQSISFSYDDVSTNISYLESKYEDQDDQYLDIDNEAQLDLDPDPTHAPNPRPKWA